jgi:hypothetical protein
MLKYVILFLVVINIQASVFFNGKVEKKAYLKQDYYNFLELDDIRLNINECDKKGENCNTDIVLVSFKDANKTQKRIFNFDFGTIKIIAKGRYDNHTAAIVSQKITTQDEETKSKKEVFKYWLISNISGEYTKSITLKTSSKTLKKDDTPLILENFGLVNFKVTETSYETNPKGDISAVAIDSDNLIRVSNGKKWISINNYSLAEHGDRSNILSVYPDTDTNRVFVAIYKYVNPFNKGLDLIVVDFDKESYFDTTLYNSDESNFGWNPRIYSDEEKVFITAIDSSYQIDKSVILNKNSLDEIKYSISPYIKGFESEPYITFMFGASVMKNFWYMNSAVRNPTTSDTIAKTEYEIASTLSWSTYMQGRIGDTQIGVSYMQSKMDEQEGIKGDISQFLSMTFDFNSLFSKQTTLRVLAEYSKLNGVAKNDYGDNEIGSGFAQTSINKVDTSYWMGALLLMWERGIYSGFSYAKYSVPSVVGLTDKSKNVVYTDYDKNLGLHDIKFLIGYDVSSYANRYEVNYNKFYIGGNLGFGIGLFDISNDVINRLELAAGDKTIVHKYAWSFSGELEFGYIFQRRFRSLKGMGYSIVAGYRANMGFITASQSSDDVDSDGNDTTINGNELSFEHEKLSIKHGPFILFNWIF